MSLAESPLVSSGPRDRVQTKADNDLLASETDKLANETGKKAMAAWQALIDHTLIDWGCCQQPFIDDDLTPPRRNIISKAIDVAQFMMDQKRRSPDRVIPDPDGGIVFEIRSAGTVETIHIWDNETVEYYRLQNGRVVDRYLL